MIKKIFITILLYLFLCGSSYSDLNYEPIGKTYVFEDHALTISNNGFLQEIYLCKPTAGKCKLIDKAFSFEGFAKECDGIKAKNIYFAQDKEYYFQGGFNENAPLKIYDLEGNFHGTAPNIEYAKPWCIFYD